MSSTTQPACLAARLYPLFTPALHPRSPLALPPCRDAAAAEAACGALSAMLCDQPDNAVRLGKCEGVEAVVSALQMHAASAVGVAEEAVAALRNATSDVGDNVATLVRFGGIPAIASALQHPDLHAAAAEDAVVVLYTAATATSEFAAKVRTHMDVVKAVRDRFEDEEGVQEEVADLLELLTE